MDIDRILCITPARGGSTRIPNKNIALLGGIPLLSHTIRAVKRLPMVLRHYVSTDCQEIANVARSEGAIVLDRPREFATAEASTEDVLLHVLSILQSEGLEFEWILTLPPTSPFRSTESINLFLRQLDNTNNLPDCFMSVKRCYEDLWLCSHDPDRIQRLFPSAPRRQQDREPLFVESSAIYLTKLRALTDTRSILGRCVKGLELSEYESLDINEPSDLHYAEYLLTNRTAATQ